MQMKLWGIKKMNASEKYWKKCNTQIDDIRHQKHFSYYDLWFHSDKKIKNRFLNDELI